MEWKQFGSEVEVAGRPVPVRSLRLPDELGNLRRYRVTTCWDPASGFTAVPAESLLAREKNGLVGAVVLGRNGGHVKIGRRLGCQPFIFVPFNSLSLRTRRRLTRQVRLLLFSDGNFIFGREASAEAA